MKKRTMHRLQMKIKRKLLDWRQKRKLKLAVAVNLVAVVNQDVVHQAAQREQATGGIAQLSRVPAALFIVDIGHEHIALAEAKRLGVGTFGVVDTNCDPNKVDFAIPANDDATKSIAIITQYITAAIAEGLAERQAAKDEETDDASLTDENQKKAARLEAEAQAEAGGGGKPRGGGQPRRRTPSSPKRTSNR